MNKYRMHPIKSGRSTRMGYSNKKEVIDMPNLIEVQVSSYEWFLTEGLREAFDDISPITDFGDHLSLEFVRYELRKPKYTIEECKERDANYAAPLKVTVRLHNKENGESADTGHMWNCAKIGGEWYHIDVTWNDGDAHIQRYLYLNLTTEAIKKNHTISPLYNSESDSNDICNVFVPECTSEEYNYFKREYVTLYDLDESDALLAAFLETVRNGGEYFDFLISEDLDYAETTQAISDSYGYQWIEDVNGYNSGGAQISTDTKFYTYENINAVTFHLEYTE